MHRGVYADFTGAPTREAQLWAALLRAGPGAVLSHWTAAERHGLAGQAQCGGPPHRARRASPGAVGRRSPGSSSIGHVLWIRPFIPLCHHRARAWSTPSLTSSRCRQPSRRHMTGSAVPSAARRTTAGAAPGGDGHAPQDALESRISSWRSATPRVRYRSLSAATCGASNGRTACPLRHGRRASGRGRATDTWTTCMRSTGPAWRSTGPPRTRQDEQWRDKDRDRWNAVHQKDRHHPHRHARPANGAGPVRDGSGRGHVAEQPRPRRRPSVHPRGLPGPARDRGSNALTRSHTPA